MKLLSVAVPCYNSQDYMRHAVESLLSGGDEVEILIVDDGSTDATGQIADDYARRYPGIVRAVHKENGGHGDAVMTGLANATGLYFKVVDSDDWVDAQAYPRVLEVLRGFTGAPIDMLVSNYIYDKAGTAHHHITSYVHALPQDRVFGWEAARRFHKGQYILMHSVIYRAQLLRDCGLTLPKHTFYVDDLYVYEPLRHVKRLYYLNADFYHYYIGRDDQSVQEQVLMRRIDQYLLVNRLMVSRVDLNTVGDVHLRRYMIGFLEIITAVSSVMLLMDGSKAALEKRDALWAFIRERDPALYRRLRRGVLGRLVLARTRPGRAAATLVYRVSQKIYGFN